MPDAALPTLDELESARAVVARHMAPTPHIRWSLLASRTGAEVWVKHENHTPIGAFKIRGGLNYMNRLKSEQPDCPGVITATRGNHGQSVALAASLAGISATILVPFGNNPEKNAAMKVFGADLIEHGDDFQEAYEHADGLAAEKGLRAIPPYHPWLIEGVGTYALEFLAAEQQIYDIIMGFEPLKLNERKRLKWYIEDFYKELKYKNAFKIITANCRKPY